MIESTPSRSRTVAGVLLAAGTSTRFGDENKLLARIEGEPVVRRAARALGASDVDFVVVVVGHEADRVRAALREEDVEFVRNPAYEDGQATSVRAAVSAMTGRPVDAAVFALGDMPFVDVDTINAVIRAYADGDGTAIAPSFEGRRGNPVLFDSRHFDHLADVDGDTGGREVFCNADGSSLVEVDDRGVRRDIDTRDDVPDEG